MAGTQVGEGKERGKVGEGGWARSFKTKMKSLDIFLSVMCFKQRCDLTYVSKMSLHGTKQEGVPGGRGVTRGG